MKGKIDSLSSNKGFILKKLNSIFNSDIEDVEYLNSLSRNIHIAISLTNKMRYHMKIFSNIHQYQNEIFFYKFFSNVPLLKTPKLHHIDENFFITDYLGKSHKIDPIKLVKDIANLHNFSISDLTNDLNFKPIINTFNADLVGLNIECPEVKSFCSNLKYLISNDINLSLVHGDLYSNNILLKNNEYHYIDFEFSKISHPGCDLTLTLIHYPLHFEQILDYYIEARKSFDSKFKMDKNEILFFALYRLSELLSNLNLKKDLYTKKIWQNGSAIKFKRQCDFLLNNIIALYLKKGA
jgi:hypothetical protein